MSYSPPPPKIKQIVYTEDDTYVSTTSSIPDDNTIPQNTEGAEYTELATAITPQDSASKLLIEVFLPIISSVDADVTIALFKDSEADALTSTVVNSNVVNTQSTQAKLMFIDDSSDTSGKTYKVRYGDGGGSSVFVGGQASELMSTAKKAYLRITEYMP
ncbi:MAG: hypothetical protein NE327_06350 [Lentisphaeraceae bacterium]|nr:hypothetical protein [Lentisphaeraceae bacterium]